jgi:oligopeptide/dipeptide ABC transporter ATP-binding protein
MNTIPAANPPGAPLPTIAGQVPPPGQRPNGCSFTPRCPASVAQCPVVLPELAGGEHKARCWNPAA